MTILAVPLGWYCTRSRSFLVCLRKDKEELLYEKCISAWRTTVSMKHKFSVWAYLSETERAPASGSLDFIWFYVGLLEVLFTSRAAEYGT